jgi:hypothetical protein
LVGHGSIIHCGIEFAIRGKNQIPDCLPRHGLKGWESGVNLVVRLGEGGTARPMVFSLNGDVYLGKTVSPGFSHGTSQERTFKAVPDKHRNDGAKHHTDVAKGVQWHGLSRPGRAPSRSADVRGVGFHRAFYRTRSRIELPRSDILVGLVGIGFALFGFLPCLRLCPLAGLGFGHVIFAFLNRHFPDKLLVR